MVSHFHVIKLRPIGNFSCLDRRADFPRLGTQNALLELRTLLKYWYKYDITCVASSKADWIVVRVRRTSFKFLSLIGFSCSRLRCVSGISDMTVELWLSSVVYEATIITTSTSQGHNLLPKTVCIGENRFNCSINKLIIIPQVEFNHINQS